MSPFGIIIGEVSHSYPCIQFLHPSRERCSRSWGQTILSLSNDLIQSFPLTSLRLPSCRAHLFLLSWMPRHLWSQSYVSHLQTWNFLFPQNIYFVKANQRIHKFTQTAGVCFCQECSFHFKDIVSGTRNINDGRAECRSVWFHWVYVATGRRAKSKELGDLLTLPTLTVAARKTSAQEDWKFRAVLLTLCDCCGTFAWKI